MPRGATARRPAGIVKLIGHAEPTDTADGCHALLNCEKAAVRSTASHPPVLGAPSRVITRQRIGWRLHQHCGQYKERRHNIRREAHGKTSQVVTRTYTSRLMFIPGIGLWSNSTPPIKSWMRHRRAKARRPADGQVRHEFSSIAGSYCV
jgi:hypothetical protein